MSRVKKKAGRSSLGDTHLKLGEQTIHNMMQRTAAVMLDHVPSRDKVIAMLFDPIHIEKAQAACGLVMPNSERIEYELPGMKYIGLVVNFDGSHCLPIRKERMNPQQSITPLLDLAIRAHNIYLQFEEAKAVLRWLNKNATPGAIRYYFPAARKLCPAAEMPDDVPTNYGEPVNVHRWLDRIRRASVTLAAAAMIPDDVRIRQRDQLWINFATRTITDGGPAHILAQYDTDYGTFNL